MEPITKSIIKSKLNDIQAQKELMFRKDELRILCFEFIYHLSIRIDMILRCINESNYNMIEIRNDHNKKNNLLK